ncbi:MAG: hypothetical protein LUO89_10305, partial [Methanothrix sp.]|nr:hypothetical protein [Methanothrix sp.]
ALSQTATAPSGSGTSGDPYLIATLDNLYWVTQNSGSWGAYFVQTADIDASSTSSWSSGSGFSPIGYAGTNFTGTYNGGGHAITGLFINRSSTDWVAMFGTTVGATIKNLHLINVNITGNHYIGALVGSNYGSTIDSCFSSGTVSTSEYEVGGLVGGSGGSSTISNCSSAATVTGGTSGMVGGLVGVCNATTISNCSTSGSVIDTVETWARAGGLVGETDYSTITNCYTTATITSMNYVGGMVGYNQGSVFSSCYSAATVLCASYNGGFVGYNSDVSTISNCYSTARVIASGTWIGGFVGYNVGGSNNPLITNCYSSGSVSGSSTVGGVAGANSATLSNCFWNTDSAGSTGVGIGTSTGATGATTTAMKDPLTFGNAGWDSTAWYIGTGINNGFPFLKWQTSGGYPMVTTTAPSGSGTSGDPYLIASLNNLAWLQKSSNSSAWNKYFKQTTNIDASSTSLWNSASGFSPIGIHGSTKFTGTYDGNAHTISGLTISLGGSLSIGMFGETNGATIKNLGLVNESITANQYVGGIVGFAYGATLVSKCFTTGTVIANSYWAGGIAGYLTDGGTTMSNCYSLANVGSYEKNGGLIAETYNATVTNCYSTGNVGGYFYLGGLVGLTNGSANNCFWDTQTSGQSSSAEGTGETTLAMKTYSTFSTAGWDFTNTWAMHSAVNNGYPYLRGITPVSSSSSSPPTAITQSASIVTITSAQANGAVNSNTDTTVVRFLYGTSSGTYTDSIAASQSPLVPWDSINVSAGLSGLLPATTYYVRVAASSNLGYVRGDEMSFTTRGFPALSSVPGSALSFNSASSQYISVPDNSSLQLTDNLTFEAWVYPTGSGNMTIIDKGNYNYLFEIKPNGQPGLGLYTNGTWYYSAGTVSLNTWSHVALVFQTGTNGIKFYLNGHLLSQATASGPLTTNTGTFAIGEQAPGNCNCNFFKGMMDEVRVWGVARSEQQIQADMHQTLTGMETGLISYWQLNEGSGTATADSITGNNGVLTNGPTWLTSEAPVGKYGTYHASASPDSAGPSGSNIAATITSPADSLNFLGLYSYGSPTDAAVTTETFPSGIDKRWPVIWGIHEFGNDTANVTLSYGSLGGIQNEAGLKVLQREAADSPWVDVTSSFAQNTSAHTFTQTGVHTFSQFSIGAGSDNALPV